MGPDKEEKDFLHSLATPLGTAIFLTDSLLDQANGDVKEPADLNQLKLISMALNQMCKLLQSRRELVAAKKSP